VKSLDAKLLLENEDYPWFGVLQWQISQNEAAEWFEHEPYHSFVAGVDDADYWVVEFDCGLQVMFEYVNRCTRGTVYASEPVANHVKRHFPERKSQLVDFHAGAFREESEATIRRFSGKFPELLELKSYQVWRQGDDGNAMQVGEPTSKRDAECRVAEFESHHHKQIYWVSRVAEV
jgi:hypothetical protein